MSNATTFSLPAWAGGERTLSGRDLDDALESWLADDLAGEAFAHVYGWTDEEGDR